MPESQDPVNAALAEAITHRRVRYFVASRGEAKGKTGPEDTALFAEHLMVMQECAILLGEKLGMNAVASAISYEKEETAGFCFNPNSNPHNPEVAGGIINRRMPMREFVASIRNFINE